jgi:phospholipid N-methyltransferase
MSSILKKLYEKLVFFLHFFKNPIKLSTPMTTCSGIHEEIKKQVQKRNPKTIVELGAGVGSVTEHIFEVMPEDAQLLCIEQEEAFCERLREKYDDRVTVMQGDALQLDEHVKDTPWEQSDAIISTVPLIIDGADDLCEQIRFVLKPNGLYMQVANLPGPMKKHFDIEESWFYPTNIPPERLHLARDKAS